MKPFYVRGDDECFAGVTNEITKYLEENKNNPNMIISFDNLWDKSFDDENPGWTVQHNKKVITIIEKRDRKIPYGMR